MGSLNMYQYKGDAYQCICTGYKYYLAKLFFFFFVCQLVGGFKQTLWLSFNQTNSIKMENGSASASNKDKVEFERDSVW